MQAIRTYYKYSTNYLSIFLSVYLTGELAKTSEVPKLAIEGKSSIFLDYLSFFYKPSRYVLLEF